MVLRIAQRIRAARFAQQARNPAHIPVALLVRAAVRIPFAFDAPAARLRVAHEARLARAHRRIAARRALGIATAQHTALARIAALCPAERVQHARLGRGAIAVAATAHLLHANVVLAVLEFGARCVRLARRLADALQADLIADAVALRGAQRTADATVADRSRLALLIAATVLYRHAAEQRIARRLRMARANAHVILHRAVGIAATAVLELARIHATVVHARQTDGAITVVRALDDLAQRVRIAARMRWTRAQHLVCVHRALSVLAAHFGRPLARIRAAILLAGRAQRAIRVRGALVRIAAAALERIADQAGGTRAREGTGRVLALRRRMAWRLGALVDVLACAVALRVVAFQARADGLVVLHVAHATGAGDLIARVCVKIERVSFISFW